MLSSYAIRHESAAATAIVVRSAVPDDIPRIVAIHQAAFEHSFLSHLGAAFLHRYYSLVLEDRGGIVLVAKESNDLDGFVAGFLHPDAFYRRMRRNTTRLITPTLSALLHRPSIIGRVVYNARRIGRSVDRCTTACELASIGVRPHAGGKGIGRSLVEAFLEKAWKRGAEYVYLTTDAEGNEAANRLYWKLGFQLGRSFEQYKGRRMNEYIIGRRLSFEWSNGAG